MKYTRVLAAIGGILKLFSLALLVPLGASLIWDEGVDSVEIPWTGIDARLTTVVFLLTFLFVLLLGFVLQYYGVRELDELREREGYLIVGFSWLLIPVLGSIPFLLTGLTRAPLDAFFEAMSGVTTTGATILAFPLEQYPPSTMLWRAVLQWVGGIGIVVLSVSIIGRVTQGGHRILEMEAPGQQVQRLKPRITETAKALSRLYVGFSAVIFAVYLLLMRFGPVPLDWRQAVYDAMLHTFTTISTGGFSHRTDSLAYYQSPALLWAAIVFMVVAGGAFPLYWAFFHGRARVLWRNAELRFYLGIFVVAAVVISALLFLEQARGPDAITHGAFQAASFLTTTGYTSTDHNRFPDMARLVLLLLMFTGGMAGSTAGGMKVFRIHIFLKLVRRELQKLLHPHAFVTVKSQGRILPDEVLRRLFVFFFSYVTLFLIGSMVYMASGADLVTGLSASASSIGNVGPAFDTASTSFAGFTDAAKLAAVLQMWLGRLEIFTVLLLFVPATYRD